MYYHNPDNGVPRLDRQTFDAAYVERLKSGDADTQADFTRYFGDLLLFKLRARIRSPQLVEDIRQETFLRVFVTLRRDGLQSPERLGAFVLSVCNNVMFEALRAEGRTAQMPENAPDPADQRVDTEAAMVTEERKATVRSVLATMPPKDRDLLRSVFLEEENKDEVCRRYSVDRQYLRVLLHRARNRFRDALERDAARKKGA